MPFGRRTFGSDDCRSRVWYGRFFDDSVGGREGPTTIANGIRVRRDAGEWMRARLRHSAGVVVALVSGNVGMVVGVGLAGFAGWQAAALPVLCLAAATLLLARRYERGAFSRLIKGVVAERSVGGLIEYAITAPGCAIAHSVTEIADIGDIDHLIATPQCLWVVETKYRRVPNDRFAEVLRRISANVEAVRRWAPSVAVVRGCLVLAVEDRLPRKRIYENGQVEVFDPKSLAREIYEDSTRRTCEDGYLTARRVWALAGEEFG